MTKTKMVACCLECNSILVSVVTEKLKICEELKICKNEKCEMYEVVVSNWYNFESE